MFSSLPHYEHWKRSYLTVPHSHPERVAGSTGNHIHVVDSIVRTEMEPRITWEGHLGSERYPAQHFLLLPMLCRCDLVGGPFLSQATCHRDLEDFMLSSQLELKSLYQCAKFSFLYLPWVCIWIYRKTWSCMESYKFFFKYSLLSNFHHC